MDARPDLHPAATMSDDRYRLLTAQLGVLAVTPGALLGRLRAAGILTADNLEDTLAGAEHAATAIRHDDPPALAGIMRTQAEAMAATGGPSG